MSLCRSTATGPSTATHLDKVRFAEDVVVNGTSRSLNNGNVKAEFDISGVVRGHLTLRANSYPQIGGLTIRGELDGQRVAAVIPQV